jgi:hypothetical protein
MESLLPAASEKSELVCCELRHNILQSITASLISSCPPGAVNNHSPRKMSICVPHLNKRRRTAGPTTPHDAASAPCCFLVQHKQHPPPVLAQPRQSLLPRAAQRSKLVWEDIGGSTTKQTLVRCSTTKPCSGSSDGPSVIAGRTTNTAHAATHQESTPTWEHGIQPRM